MMAGYGSISGFQAGEICVQSLGEIFRFLSYRLVNPRGEGFFFRISRDRDYKF